MTTIVNGIAELKAREGEHLGYSEWLEVTQDRINTFAAATDDHQWIHTDPERAAAGPYGTTIAHGYLTLSLLIPLWSELLEVRGVKMNINYGLNKVRFPAPVPSGSKIRLGATLATVNDIPGGAEAVVDAVIEREGGGKPVCVAQGIYRFYN
jgi:acyl dehydratase